MRFGDLLYETWQSLMANKGRNLLTILGVVIGIAAVIAMTALIGGIKQGLYSEMGMDQSRAISISAYSPNGRGLTFTDLDRMEKNLPGYEFLTGVVVGYAEITGEKDKADTFIMGVEPEYFEARGIEASSGTLFSEESSQAREKIVVLDESLARTLFGNDANPIGRTLTMGELGACTVVGIVSAGGMSMGGATAYVPALSASTAFGQGGEVSEVMGFAREGVDPERLAEQTRSYLGDLWNLSSEEREDYIWVQTMKELIEEVDSFMGAFQIMMTAVASVSLLVGGIGIMNMMLTNVTERIREIGLRKALGARRSGIVAQFLFESIALTLAGGVIGTLVGYAGAWMLAGFAGGLFTGEETAIVPVISPAIALGTAAICVGIGVLFGFYPAQRAARLDPVESLRHQ